jgi:hypothetical protein
VKMIKVYVNVTTFVIVLTNVKTSILAFIKCFAAHRSFSDDD